MESILQTTSPAESSTSPEIAEAEAEVEAESPKIPPSQSSSSLAKLTPATKSVDQLQGLSAALSIFTKKYSELQGHLNWVEKAIDFAEKEAENKKDKQVNETDSTEKNKDKQEEMALSILSNIQCICDWMSGKGLQKYIISNLNDIPKLRQQVPIALSRAPNPSKLVFDSLQHFYLHSSKAYAEDSNFALTTSRQATLLALEFFLLAESFDVDNFDIDKSTKTEADAAVWAWTNRIASEGGLSNAKTEDVHGLLLFLASFGFPSSFELDDLIVLVELANLNEDSEIADILRRSPFLKKKMPEIIGGMMKRQMSPLAVDAARTFRFEHSFPPRHIWEPFLRETEKGWGQARADLALSGHHGCQGLQGGPRRQAPQIHTPPARPALPAPRAPPLQLPTPPVHEGPRCYVCNSPNHMIRDCPERRRGPKKRGRGQQQNQQGN